MVEEDEGEDADGDVEREDDGLKTRGNGFVALAELVYAGEDGDEAEEEYGVADDAVGALPESTTGGFGFALGRVGRTKKAADGLARGEDDDDDADFAVWTPVVRRPDVADLTVRHERGDDDGDRGGDHEPGVPLEPRRRRLVQRTRSTEEGPPDGARHEHPNTDEHHHSVRGERRRLTHYRFSNAIIADHGGMIVRRDVGGVIGGGGVGALARRRQPRVRS